MVIHLVGKLNQTSTHHNLKLMSRRKYRLEKLNDRLELGLSPHLMHQIKKLITLLQNGEDQAVTFTFFLNFFILISVEISVRVRTRNKFYLNPFKFGFFILSVEKRDFAGSRSFGSSRSRMNASYATGRIMGIRHGRAGRISGGRNVRNSSAPGGKNVRNSSAPRFVSSNRRSTGRRREEESRRSSQRHKPNDVRNSSRRSPANSKNNNDSTDKEDLIRFMRRKEEEHRKKEEELVMEREREKIRYEREKLERDKLELETLRLQAQLAQATQFQFAAVAGLPQGGAAAVSVPLITGTGDSSTSALHNQHFGDGGFNHRRERESAMPTAFSSERRSIDISAKSEMSRSKSRTSKQNDRDERSDRYMFNEYKLI